MTPNESLGMVIPAMCKQKIYITCETTKLGWPDMDST